MALYVWLALGACFSAATAAATGGIDASLGFNPKLQSSALLPDGARAFFALKMLADSTAVIGSQKIVALDPSPGASLRRMLQSGSCPTGQIPCAEGDPSGCIPAGWVCCNDGSGACEPQTTCVPNSKKCAPVCSSGQKLCDNTRCIPTAETCCGDGNGASCPSNVPVCVKNTNTCVSAGNMAQAKIGMMLGSLMAVVLAMNMV